MQLLALSAIARGDARSQVALADRLVVDAPAMSRLVERLAEDGLLKRSAGENRRCVRLEVTEAGLVELEVLRAELDWLEGEVRQRLTVEEVAMLGQLLGKLQEALVQVLDAAEAEGEPAE